MLVALLVSPVAAQTIDPINGFAIEPFNPACTLDGGPTSIIAGRDGNLWFTESFGNQIGRITPAGVITEFPPLSSPTSLSGPDSITVGPDGNLWFTEDSGNKIGRITPAGVITEFPLPPNLNCPPNGSNSPLGITAGPDGNLWFTESCGNKVGRITPTGDITEFAVATPGSGPMGITLGADGNLWFTESNSNKIGRVVFAGPPVTPPPVTPPPVTPPPTVPPTDPPADPAAMIRDLMASVEGSYLKGNIREGFERSLYSKLRNALAAVKGQRPDPVACNALTAFSNEVQAQSGKQLDR